MVIPKQFSFPYGLIGDDLILKKKVNFSIDKEGRISNLDYRECKEIQIDFGKKNPNPIIIPGLINSHIHIGDSFAKEIGYNKGLIETVAPPDGIKHQSLKKTNQKDKIQGIKKASIEMISNGITYFIDFRENGINGIKLLKKALRNRSIQYIILGRFGNKNEIKDIFKNADGIGLSSYRIVDSEIKKTLSINKETYQKLITCHHAELKRKPKLFERIIKDGIIDVIIHGTKLSQMDLNELKNSSISLVLCPRCNGYFGVGFPPILDILKLNIPISIGTDNIMVNSPDLFEELRYLYLITRVLNNQKEFNLKLDAKELLKMITINAATNFDLQNKIGSIKEGKQGDFLEIDLNSPNYFCSQIKLNKIYPLLVQRTKPENIKKVYIKGERIFERK